MQRRIEVPRDRWEPIVEEQGLIFHHTANGAYWDECASYRLNARQVDELDQATNELQARCLDAGQKIIDDNLFKRMGIPAHAIDAITRTWNEEPPALYGRFDFIYDGRNPPRLLEYNADTPTALIEASVVQWYWKETLHPQADQFNSIHERPVGKWRDLRRYLRGAKTCFAAVSDPQSEDLMTVSYLRDTAIEAGIATAPITMADIGWDAAARTFRVADGSEIESIVKLYPWEWMVREEFGRDALASSVQWIEPAWKMLWSNKALLAVLWEMFPNHPNLVPAYLDDPHDLTSFVKKPKMSREGANITVVSRGRTIVETAGDYGEEGFVYQQLIPSVNTHHPVVGSWVIDGESAGIGIRESSSLVTDNMSRFVPHYLE